MTADAARPAWIDQEPPLAARGWATARRLMGRAAFTWPLWVTAALILAALAALARARAPVRYEASVVLRVSEGQLTNSTAAQGSRLSIGTLRAYLSDLGFTNERLLGIMRRHAAIFPDAINDPPTAVAAFRDQMSVSLAENDFVEDRGAGDPPRTARVTVTFKAGNPELAWRMATEVAELVAGATLQRQRESMQGQRDAAVAALKAAEEEVMRVGAAPQDAGRDQRLKAAGERLAAAQKGALSVDLALRALAERQVLRFDVVDPGRVPERASVTDVALTTFFTVLAAGLLGLPLLAGAFDPRVLDGEDLAAVGLQPVGRVPPLPARGGVAARV